MIEALVPDRADETLGEGILPWAAVRTSWIPMRWTRPPTSLSDIARSGTAAPSGFLVPSWFQLTPTHRHPSTGRPDTDLRSHARIGRHHCPCLGSYLDS